MSWRSWDPQSRPGDPFRWTLQCDLHWNDIKNHKTSIMKLHSEFWHISDLPISVSRFTDNQELSCASTSAFTSCIPEPSFERVRLASKKRILRLHAWELVTLLDTSPRLSEVSLSKIDFQDSLRFRKEPTNFTNLQWKVIQTLKSVRTGRWRGRVFLEALAATGQRGGLFRKGKWRYVHKTP